MKLWRLRHDPAAKLATVNERSRPVGTCPDAELVENVLGPQLRDLNDPRSPYAYPMFLVTYDCGLRARDAKNLKPEQCDFERRVLVVPTSKTSNVAVPPMSDRLIEMRRALVGQNATTGWVFPDLRTGKPYVKGPMRVWRCRHVDARSLSPHAALSYRPLARRAARARCSLPQRQAGKLGLPQARIGDGFGYVGQEEIPNPRKQRLKYPPL